MKRTNAKLRALLQADAKHPVGFGVILEDILEGQRESANKRAFCHCLFNEDLSATEVAALFESLLCKLPDESAGDLLRLFSAAYFEGASGFGEWTEKEAQRKQRQQTGRSGGKTSGEKRARKAQEQWQDRALRIARDFRKKQPGRGRPTIASRIKDTLDSDAPGERQIINVLKKWEDDGLLEKAKKTPKGK